VLLRIFQALVEKARENVSAPPLEVNRVSKETVFKRADARGAGDASAGARMAAHKHKQQQQQQQQGSAAHGGMDGARIKANQIANLRLMAVLNYRLTALNPFYLHGFRGLFEMKLTQSGRNQKKASRGEGGASSSYL
jgi:hypothetical protein